MTEVEILVPFNECSVRGDSGSGDCGKVAAQGVVTALVVLVLGVAAFQQEQELGGGLPGS